MEIDPNVVIARLGGTNAVAELFQIKAPSVSEWRKKGIPKVRLQFLGVARPDVLVPVEKASSSTPEQATA